MALIKNDLVIGNIVYRLDVNTNVARRNKLKMTDIDGNEWTRYDIALWTFRVIPMKVCGTIKQIVRGTVSDDCTEENQYHMQCLPDKNGKQDETIYYWSETELIGPFYAPEFFSNEDSAIAVGESTCVNKNQA
jgi:hypothetical protein